METTARNRTIGGIVIGAIILILLLVLFSCTVNSDPKSSEKEDPTTGESSLPSDPDTLEPDDKPSDKDSDEPEVVDDDIVPAANTGVTFIPAGNVPSGSTPTCELDPSACEGTRPPGAGVDICEIRPDLAQCQEPTPPTTPPGDGEPTTPPDDGDDDCLLPLGLLCPEDPDPEDPGPEDPEDNTPPNAVRVDECLVTPPTGVTISWEEPFDDSGKIDHYTVYSEPNAGKPGNTTDTSARFPNLEPGRSYHFRVTATDASGKESRSLPSSEVDCDLAAPDVPVGVDVELGELSDSTLEVSWERSEDNPDDQTAVGDVTYNIYRDGELLTNVDGTSYEDSGLKAGTEYTYAVQAVDGVGNKSERSAEDSETTTKIAPTVPTNVRITDVNSLGFTVRWDGSTDQDGKTDPANIVYIVNVEGGCLIPIPARVTGATSTEVTCVNLFGGETTATVTAEDEDGNQSAPSKPASTTAPRDDAPALRSNTPGKATSDSPADKPASPEVPDVEAPAEEPTEEDAPLLPGLDDVLPGGDDAAEAPAEEPAEPEATPSESESPAARPTTEEPADEATEEAPAEEDEGGLLDNIGDALTSAVAAVF